MADWAQSQQTALEQSIRANPVVPGEAAIERWTRIASAVPGKGVKSCLARIKSLKVRKIYIKLSIFFLNYYY